MQNCTFSHYETCFDSNGWQRLKAWYTNADGAFWIWAD